MLDDMPSLELSNSPLILGFPGVQFKFLVNLLITADLVMN